MNSLKRIVTKTALHALVMALFATICLHPVGAGADLCPDTRWTQAVKKYAFPEDNTQYYVFQFRNNPNKQVMLTVSARFPYARYIGYTLYSIDNTDPKKGDPIEFNGQDQHLRDIEIQADPLNQNPYLDNIPRNIKNRDYTIYIVKEGSRRIKPNGEPDVNTLVIPDNISQASLFFRIYVPDNELDPQGGVALPTITATAELDATSSAEIECPAVAQSSVGYFDVVNGKRFDRSSILFEAPDTAKIETFRPGDYGLFPNGDCPYLTTPLVRPKNNNEKIAVLRFKAPTFPDTRAGDGFSADDEVRYWSVCMGDWRSTTSTGCIADQDANIDENGFVNLLIGPDRLVAGDNRWNNLQWGTIADPILIFRQISPRQTFEYSFEVPGIAFTQTDGTVYLSDIYKYKRSLVASETIGQYAPSGKYCTIGEFQQDWCGFKSH